MNAGKVILSTVAGVALGAALGILFAPDKGSSTRSKISKKSGDLTADLEMKFNNFVDKFSKKFDKLKDEAGDIAEDVKFKAEEAIPKFGNNKV